MGASYPIASAAVMQASRRPRRLRVLVIAPHPDDDAIGCGGTLRRLVACRARISILYVTDGSASHLQSKRFPPPALRSIREAEAGAALRALGVRGKPQFLRAADGRLGEADETERGRLAGAIAQRIAATRATVIFSPWLRDPHPDHIATAALVEQALGQCGRRPACYLYSVWLAVRGSGPEHPGTGEATALDVPLSAADRARKRAAIMQHKSQTGKLIDDDPSGFRIDEPMLETWLAPVERFYRRHDATSPPAGKTSRC